MRLVWVGHGSFLVESDGCRVLVDPLLGAAAGAAALPAHDVLVIAGRRPGRFDVPTLAALSRDVEVVIGDDPALAACLERLGYSRVSVAAPYEERPFAGAVLALTPGASVEEWGVLVAGATSALWNVADLALDAAVVERVRARWPRIDVLVAAWRPAPRGGALASGRERLARYGEHLDALAAIDPGLLVPWGDAEPSRPAAAAVLPRIDVPASRQRFAEDATRRLAGGRGRGRVTCLDPGDVVELAAGPSGPSSSVSRPQRVDAVEVPPAAADAAPAADDPLLTAVTRLVEEELAAAFRQGDAVLAEHRRRGVVYRLDVALGATKVCWSFDFGEGGEVPMRRGLDPRADFVVTIDAGELLELASGRRDWAAVVAGGGYGLLQVGYRVEEHGLEPLPDLEDPLALRYSGTPAFLRVKQRQIEGERGRWASKLLGRLGLGTNGHSAPDPGPAIPLFVTEEHNEAFFVWHLAILNGLLPARGNVLLHVDQHPDMRSPRFDRPLPAVGADLAEIAWFTYHQLDIESFIAPACLQGVFERVEWLQRDEPPAAWRFAVSSLRGERKVLSVDRQRPGDAPPAEAPWVEWSARRPDGPGPAPPSGEGATILGIDLDYFSCDDAINRRASIEITRAELESFRADPFHALRLGNRFRARVEDGRCFLDYNTFSDDIVSPRKVSDEVVAERVRELAAYLRKHHVRPRIIHVTRSRHTGFTPADQWQRIEEMVLGALHSLYDLRVMPFEDLRRQAEGHMRRRGLVAPAERAIVDGAAAPAAATHGGPSKLRSATLPVVPSDSFPTHLDFPGGRVLLIPTGCNNRCTFCMVDEFIETNDHHGRPRGEAPLSAELRALIDDLPAGHLVDFFGAEPTLHESFFGLLQAAAERGLHITLASNARVFSSAAYTRRVAALAPPSQLVVRTSILGATAEVHDAIARARGAFDQMLKGVRNLVAEGYDVGFNMVLTRENAHQAADVPAIGAEHGVKTMKISGLIDFPRNAASFVPYREAAAAVEAFCAACERLGVSYAIEKLPLCVAPRRMHKFVFEQGVYNPDRGVMVAPGQPCRECVVRNVCYGVEPEFVAAGGVDSLETVRTLPPEVQVPVDAIVERRLGPAHYRVTFTRPADPDLPYEAWAELLRFKQRCELEVGDLCVERGGVA
jgi:sulfatase maturation enzyme AslB (radical SAM superfamily)